MPHVEELEQAVANEVNSVEPAPQKQTLRERWQNPRFRRRVIWAITILALLALAAMYYYAGRVTTDDAQVDGHVMPVSAKIYGNVAEVLVKDNQAVRAGDVLIRIDSRDYQVKVEQARASLALAEAQASAARTGVPLTRETIASNNNGAEAQLQVAKADYLRAQYAFEQSSHSDVEAARAMVAARQAANDKAQADLARMKPLAERTEISKQQFDAVTAAARVANSELIAAQERMLAAEKESEQRKAAMLAAQARTEQAKAALSATRASRKQVDIQSAQAVSAAAAVSQAEANLKAAELQLSYAEIKASADGVVTRKSVEPGQIVQPGQSLLMIVPLQDIWVTANFKETQLADVKSGQKATVKVDTYGREFHGHVDSIAGATGARLSLLPTENATGNFVKVVQRIPVKIVLDPVPPEKAVLRPGMNVEAAIALR